MWTTAAWVFIVAVLLYLERFPELLHWPARILFAGAAVWISYVVVRAVRRTKFEAKKVVFSLILMGMVYAALYVICHVFVTLMAQRDESMIKVETTELSHKARIGIKAMLDGTSPVQYDREVGWVHRPGHQWRGHTVSAQGLRGTRLYEESAADPSKRLICVGDSFTFGYEVTDDQTFAAHGEQMRPGTEWINLGICGGGLTQAYLQYKKNGRTFGGKYVVIGFMTNNQKRTVNCFRALIAPGSPLAPLTKPFAKFADGRLTIEPNPYQQMSDYERLLANEAEEVARISQLDYITWSNQVAAQNPIVRTLQYVAERREIHKNVDVLLRRSDDEDDASDPEMPEGDPYGRAIWHPDSPAFKANAAVFDLFCKEVIADGRIPLIVILPSEMDVRHRAEGAEPVYGALRAHLQAKGHRHFDFLDSLEKRFGKKLGTEKFYIGTHFNGATNRLVAEEIVRELGL
jgi:hypothetical protein